MSFAQTSASQRHFLPPAVAVSSVAFALHPPEGAQIETNAYTASEPHTPSQVPHEVVTLWIPLVRRTRAPFAGVWALPGGPILWNEDLADTALRTLHSAVHRTPTYLEQLYSFGARERSAQAQRLVTIAYWALYGEADLAKKPAPLVSPSHIAPMGQRRWDDPHPGEDTEQYKASSVPEPDENVAWFSADKLPTLAFDHSEIVQSALLRLRTKTEYSAVAHQFLGETFTLAQLREVHEAIRGVRTDPANFRRQVLAQGNLIDTGATTTGTAYRPARLYQFAADFTQHNISPV